MPVSGIVRKTGAPILAASEFRTGTIVRNHPHVFLSPSGRCSVEGSFHLATGHVRQLVPAGSAGIITITIIIAPSEAEVSAAVLKRQPMVVIIVVISSVKRPVSPNFGASSGTKLSLPSQRSRRGRTIQGPAP